MMPRSSFASERTNKTMNGKKIIDPDEFYNLNNAERNNRSRSLTGSMLSDGGANPLTTS